MNTTHFEILSRYPLSNEDCTKLAGWFCKSTSETFKTMNAMSDIDTVKKIAQTHATIGFAIMKACPNHSLVPTEGNSE